MKKQQKKKQQQDSVKDRQEYATQMRLALSNKDMINEDGSLNQQYFLVKKGAYWTPQHDKELIETQLFFGIKLKQKNYIIFEKGIGEFQKMQLYNIYLRDFVKHYFIIFKNFQQSEKEIELRLCILLGINDIRDYYSQKLTEEQLKEEKEKNIAEAKQKNKFKSGLYFKY